MLFPSGCVFLPCDHGLDIFASAYARIQSIKIQSINQGSSKRVLPWQVTIIIIIIIISAH